MIAASASLPIDREGGVRFSWRPADFRPTHMTADDPPNSLECPTNVGLLFSRTILIRYACTSTTTPPPPVGGRYQALVAGITMAGVGYGGFYAHRRARAYLDELGREELRRREQERLKKGRKQAADGAQQQHFQRQER